MFPTFHLFAVDTWHAQDVLEMVIFIKPYLADLKLSDLNVLTNQHVMDCIYESIATVGES